MGLTVRVFGNPIESDWHSKMELIPNQNILSAVKDALANIGKDKGYCNIYIPVRDEQEDGVATWCITLEMETMLTYGNANRAAGCCVNEAFEPDKNLSLLLNSVNVQICYCFDPKEDSKDNLKTSSNCETFVNDKPTSYTSQRECYMNALVWLELKLRALDVSDDVLEKVLKYKTAFEKNYSKE